jgi:integrase
MLSEKVVVLNQGEVHDQIQRFLYRKGLDSENTKLAYEKNIKRFFEFVKGKELQFLTKKDIQLSLDDFEDFVEHLKEECKLNPKTINQHTTSVKELIRYLSSKKDSQGRKFIEDVSYLEASKQIRLKENKNKRGVLSVNEVFDMADLVLKEREKGEIKRLLILFSLDTCIRLSAARNLKWTDFEEREMDVLVTYVDKGNKDFRPKISKKFYNDLLSIKQEDNEIVFDISESSVEGMMKRLKESMFIPTSRKISFHSFRKAGAVFQYRITGDIMMAKAALGHSNVNTTMDYLEDEKEGILGAVSSAGNLNLNAYKEVSHEDLLKTIDQLPKNLKYILSIKLQEVLNN